jgi:hypothetical protein
MTILQSYRCRACHFGFGPIAVQPFVPSRPQVFRYCTDCKTGQSLIVTDASQPLSCVHCRSTKLLDVQRQCPVCASSNVGWESRL